MDQYVNNILEGGMENERVRQAAKAAGVWLWQVAEYFGVSDSNFSRKLRRPFSADETERALTIIALIQKEQDHAEVPDVG